MVRTIESIQSEDVWNDLLELHVEHGCECVAVLRAYVDASTRKDSGLLSVAAYLFESLRVRRFRKQWRDVFGDETFSWADLVARKEPFAHLKDLKDPKSKREHDRLVAEGVALVREYVVAGSIVSCWKQDVENFAPTWIKGFGHAYAIAGHMALVGMGNWAKRNGKRGGIAYVMEAGDEGYDQLDHLLSYASKVEGIADMYQWGQHSTIPKTVAAPFHAPDLLAWEWGKYWVETVIEPKRRMRRSLINLLIDRLDHYSFQHLSGPPLMRFFSRIHDLGVEQLEEARVELSSTSSVDVSETLQTSEPKEHDEGHE